MQIEQRKKEKTVKFGQSAKGGKIMKNVWKKLVGFTLAACTLASACVAGAVSEMDGMESSLKGSGSVEIVPMENHLAVNRNISKYGVSWEQDKGYPSYRIWVENTTDQQMRVTIAEPSGRKVIFYVSAGGNRTYTMNNATDGIHRVSFFTITGELSGTVRVRVSETPL